MNATEHKQAASAAFVFGVKMDAGPWTDARIRLAIQALRAVLLDRQQRRATKKRLAK